MHVHHPKGSFIVGERFAGNVRWPPNLVGALFAFHDGFWVNRRDRWLHVETSLRIRTLPRWRPDARVHLWGDLGVFDADSRPHGGIKSEYRDTKPE